MLGLPLLTAAIAFAAPTPQAGVLSVEGTAFVLTEADGTRLTSPQLSGAILSLPDGTVLRINAAEPDAADPDIWLHDMDVRQPDGGWAPLCTADAEGMSRGFPSPENSHRTGISWRTRRR